MTQAQTELFSEISQEQASQLNGGYRFPTIKMVGAGMGMAGSGWWRRNAGYAIRRGDYGGFIRTTDIYMRSITGILRGAGIPTPRYPY